MTRRALIPPMRGAWLVVAALVVGACNGGDGDGGPDTLPPPPETTVTTPVDYTVPAVIDVAYVEKVMAALDHVYGDAIRTLARERKITQDFLDRLAALYTGPEFDIAQRAWVHDLADGLDDLKPAPGDPATIVQRTLRLDATCIILAVERSFRDVRSAVTTTPQKFLALVPRVPERDPRHLNPTPWMISFDGFVSEPAGSEPVAPCGA